MGATGRYDSVIYRGRDWNLSVVWSDGTGDTDPYPISAVDAAINLLGVSTPLTGVIADDSATVSFSLTEVETAALPAGLFAWNVGVTSGGVEYPLLAGEVRVVDQVMS